MEYGFVKKTELVSKSFDFYKAPKISDIKEIGSQMHWMSYYKKWVPQENYYYVVENCGFEPNPLRTEGTYSKYASLDDKMDGFHYYLFFISYHSGLH